MYNIMGESYLVIEQMNVFDENFAIVLSKLVRENEKTLSCQRKHFSLRKCVVLFSKCISLFYLTDISFITVGIITRMFLPRCKMPSSLLDTLSARNLPKVSAKM